MNWSKGDVTTMVVEFTLHPPPLVSTLPLLILVVTGAFLIVLVFTTGRRAKSVRQSFLIMLIIGVVMIGLGVGLSYSSGTPSSITVGNGYLFIKSPSFGGAGNMNITSSQIQSAYVGRIGMGNLTISKQHGTNIGDFDVGVFTLAREATAYVVSDNSTSLVIHLVSGKYVILGTNDTTLLATTFSRLVFPVQSETVN